MKPLTGLLGAVMLLVTCSFADAAVIIIKYRPIDDGADSTEATTPSEGDGSDGVRTPPAPMLLPVSTPATTTLPAGGGTSPRVKTGVNGDPKPGSGNGGTTAPPSGGIGTKKDALTIGVAGSGVDELVPEDEQPAEDVGCGGGEPDPSAALGLLALIGTLRRRRKS
ncbi:MAG: hypothetical protein FJ125_04895 [Deltaproteobacteria bacterium]|nr:hypothetical protein [Deltaproteobacteria bacterium]